MVRKNEWEKEGKKASCCSLSPYLLALPFNKIKNSYNTLDMKYIFAKGKPKMWKIREEQRNIYRFTKGCIVARGLNQ